MASTKIPVELSSTPGIVDNSNATAITIDSSENTTFAGKITLGDGHQIGNDGTDNLVLNSSSAENIVLASAASLFFNTGASSLTSQGTTRVLMSSNGNVGIGNTSPDAMLRIDQDANSVALKVTGGGAGTNIAQFVRDVGADASIAINASSGEPQIQFNDTNTFAIGVNSTYFEIADNGHIGTNTRFVIDNTGNVGIGTTAPRHKLSVNGTLGSSTFSGFGLGVVGGIATAESGTTNAAMGLQCTNASTSKIFAYDYAGSAGIPISIQPDNANVFICAGGGNVGIGITNPSQLLTLKANTPFIQFAQDGSDSYAGINFGDADDANDGQILYDHDSRYMRFQVANAERIRIDASGRVGVNTTNFVTTGAKLQVKGTSAVPAVSGSNFAGSIFSVEGTSTVNISMGTTGASTYYGWIQAHDAGTGTNYKLNLNPLDGNVGINTTAPNGNLHIGSSNAEGSSANPALQIGGANTYRLGFYTDSEGGIIQNLNGDNGLQFRVKTAGEVMRIMPSGKVGIGTTAPTGQRLCIGGYSTNNSMTEANAWLVAEAVGGDGIAIGSIASSPYTTWIQSGYLNTMGTSNHYPIALNPHGGNVGIGTSTPQNTLHIATASTDSRMQFTNASSGSAYADGLWVGHDNTQAYFMHRENLPITFWTNTTERMRLDSSGNLVLGASSQISLGKFSIEFNGTSQNGTVLQTTRSATGSTFIRFNNSSGTAIGSIYQNAASTVLYSTSSDYRLKQNESAVWDGTTLLKQLKPYKFNWKADPTGEAVQGFFAHELAEVIPDAVVGEKDAVDSEGHPEYQGVDQSRLVPLLVKTIQELEARIKVLEDK